MECQSETYSCNYVFTQLLNLQMILKLASFHRFYMLNLNWTIVQLWAARNEGSSLLDSMTKAIDEVIKIRECDIYSYNPDSDGDPFLEKGAIWSVNFFFYNRKLKRVVSFRCCCTSKFAGDDFLAGALSDGEEEDALIDMDI
uniref:Repressor of RNA polymerase III transcription n=2 Tax=Aegilops tauschii subsp. strangulata TaxID=200361 RepID=A0A453DVF5_AEGTS